MDGYGHTQYPAQREEPSGALGWIALAVVAPLAAYIVHRVDGGYCGWGWSGVGGACRAILILSIGSGLFAGAFARGAVMAGQVRNKVRTTMFGLLALAAILVGMYGVKSFADYIHGGRAIVEDGSGAPAASPR